MGLFSAKKSDASRALERFLSDTRPVGSVEVVQIDGGTEWKGEFKRTCDQERIRPEVVPPSSSQYNGRAERVISILQPTAFVVRQAKNLYGAAREKIPLATEELWTEAYNWSYCSLNMTATTANPGKVSPYEMWHGEVPSFTLRPFLSRGCFT